jgi:hypothetical protein
MHAYLSLHIEGKLLVHRYISNHFISTDLCDWVDVVDWQGGQIGRILASWAIVYFVQFFFK